MKDKNEDEIYKRLEDLERRIKELSARIEKQVEVFLDEDLKARGLK